MRLAWRIMGSKLSTTAAPPLTMVVRVEIEEARIPKFLEAMKVDVDGSRQEPGCLRFDLLRDQTQPNAFVFYEVYKDEAALATHKETPHYKEWAAFKAEGGVLAQSAVKYDAIDLTV